MKIRKRASAWLVERDEGWDPQREAEFNVWKSEDIRHEIALRDLEASWNRLRQLRHLIDDPTLRPDPDVLSTGFGRSRRRSTPLALACSFAAAIAVGWGIWVTLDSSTKKILPSALAYSTTVNDYKQIALPDGSVMEMNANTDVQIDFSNKRRQIYLLRGEAHFKVEKDESRPFLVDAGSVSVKALGTEFNVRFDHDEVQVLVTEGRVSVIPSPSEHGDVSGDEPSWAVPELVTGNLARISRKGSHLIPLMTKVESEETEEMLAWKGPRLFFDATPLEEAVRQFNKQNTVKVVVEGDDLRNLSIGGSFLAEDVEAFIRLLALDDSIIVERNDDGEVVLKPAD